MNFFQRLQLKHPRRWAIGFFVPAIMITVVGFPVSILFDFFAEVWRILRNIWSDIRCGFENIGYQFSNYISLLRVMWTIWWDARLDRKLDLNKEENDGKEETGDSN